MCWLIALRYAARIFVAAATTAASVTVLAPHASAVVDGNNQSTTARCIHDPDWASLHPLLCSEGAFSLLPPTGVGHGGNHGLLGGLLGL